MKKKRNRPAAYCDFASLEEDKRIDIIGRTVLGQKATVNVITDSDPGKADRYIAKIKKRFPGIAVVERFAGPVPNTVTIKLAPSESVN